MNGCNLPSIEKIDEKIAQLMSDLRKLRAFRRALADNGPEVLEGTVEDDDQKS